MKDSAIDIILNEEELAAAIGYYLRDHTDDPLGTVIINTELSLLFDDQGHDTATIVSSSQWLSQISRNIDTTLVQIPATDGAMLGDDPNKTSQKDFTKCINKKKVEALTGPLSLEERAVHRSAAAKGAAAWTCAPLPPCPNPHRLPIQNRRTQTHPLQTPRPHRPMPAPQRRRKHLRR